MLSAHAETHFEADWRHPNFTQSILAENRKALLRRWRIARSAELVDPRVIARWFPGQRNLLELLAVLDEDEVLRIADCKAPIFTLLIHPSLVPGTSASLVQPGEFEAANRQEAFLALSARLDSIRMNLDQACVNYDLTFADAAHIGKYEPYSLWDISANPSLVMIPAASDKFMKVAASRDLTTAQRTLYMGMSRRSKDSIH